MMNAHTLPLFLWEHAIQHAVYLRNRAYTKAIKETTPYQLWTGDKPTVHHLREFGAPVWIFRQGQNRGHKFEPKSLQKIFMGFDDSSKSIKYYNPETRKILTSQNYRFLMLPAEPSPLVDAIEIDIAPDIQRKGETNRNAPKSDANPKQSKKRKNEEENQTRNLRQKTQVDYRLLDDPFIDKDDDIHETTPMSAQIIYAAFSDQSHADEDPKTLNDVR